MLFTLVGVLGAKTVVAKRRQRGAKPAAALSNGRASPPGRAKDPLPFDVSQAGQSVFGERAPGSPILRSNNPSMWGAGGQFAVFPRNLDLVLNAQLHDQAAGDLLVTTSIKPNTL